MAGTNFSLISTIDTFQTWFTRTNSLITTINTGTPTLVNDSIMWRDEQGSFSSNIATLKGTNITPDTPVNGLNVNSTLDVSSTDGAIVTTGGLLVHKSSIIGNRLTINGDLLSKSNSVIGANGASTTIEFNSKLNSDIVPLTSLNNTLGSATKLFLDIHTQKSTHLADANFSGKSLDITLLGTASTGVSVVNDAIIGGKLGQFKSNSVDTGVRNLVEIENTNVLAVGTNALGIISNAGTGIDINSGLGVGINIDSTNALGEQSLKVNSSHESTNAVSIIANSLTSGTALELISNSITTGNVVSLTSNSGSVDARDLFSISNQNVASTSTTAMNISSLAGKGIVLSSTGAIDKSLEITSENDTIDVVSIDANSLTTGSALQINTTANHSGNILDIVGTGATSTGSIVNLQTTSGDILRMSNATDLLLSFNTDGLFELTNNMTIGGNLTVNGTTTYLNTQDTLIKDTSIVLGAGSSIHENISYSSHATLPVINLVGHGFSTDNVFFIVGSASPSVIAKESLIKITVIDADSFTIEHFDGTTKTPIDTTGIVLGIDRVFSFVGPQSDINIDNAGLLIPGDTGIHSVLWDNGANYFKVNDSFKIDTTTQLLFPVGTSAERPGVSPTDTVSSAVPGAMRFNSDEMKFEGVHTGSTFQNMSTEEFSIAMSIALG